MVEPYRHRPDQAYRTQGRVGQAAIDDLTLNFDKVGPSDNDADEDEIRNRWRQLIDTDLPKAADKNTDWPVYLNHCFARILLDNAVGQFWRDVIQPPAWKNTPLPVLQTAIDIGEAILSDHADIWALNDDSLKMRGKAPRGRVAANRRRRRSGRRR